MDSPDRRPDAASRIVWVLRRVTRLVQLLPFAYLLVYAAYLFLSVFASDRLLGFLDSFVFVSPAASGWMLVLSRLLKLCRWHRAAVLIPMSSQAECLVDGYIFTFTELEVDLVNAATGTAAVVFLFLAIKHFFHDGSKGGPLRNSRLLQVQGRQ